VYMIVRPPEYLDDVRERELEMQAAEARVAQLGYMLCPHCDAEIERDFLRCPNCMRRLKTPCASCSRPLDPRWKVCPFCEAEVAQDEPQPTRRRRRRTGTTSEQAAMAEVTEAQAPQVGDSR
jgi:predicted amidophosphoribosyltransferase